MTSKLFLTFFIILTVTCCSTRQNSTRDSKVTIQAELRKLTGIDLDTSKFIVQVDSVDHTEGAFDSDYAWYANIRFENDYFDYLKRGFRSTVKFDSLQYMTNELWRKMDTIKVKGIWYADSTFYKFSPRPKNFESELLDLSIDTSSKTLNLILFHL